MKVLAVTGAVGAGCTTASNTLQFERQYHYQRLSDHLRAAWADVHGSQTPARSDLQRLGDELRAASGRHVLAELAAVQAEATDADRVVIDGVRNLGEVEWLRDRYGHHFSLIAILAPKVTRWSRIGDSEYRMSGRDETDFDADDFRDQGEPGDLGQQVALCVDSADAILNNGRAIDQAAFRVKVLAMADLLTGSTTRPPERHEAHMHAAYSQSHLSRCLKRHVGAVVVSPRGEPIGVGFNENPMSMRPCADEPTYDYRCYRDIIRNSQFAVLVAGGVRCPICAQPLQPITGPPWICMACTDNGSATNLEPFFFPERAMNWCTAIHAEDRALRVAGDRANGATIYTTAFPCFSCAEKIISSGVEEVVFTEPYPDAGSAGRLELAGIRTRQFEGVRSSAFERVFRSHVPS